MVLQVIAITAVLMDNYPFEFVTSIRVDIILLGMAVLLPYIQVWTYITKNYKLLRYIQEVQLTKRKVVDLSEVVSLQRGAEYCNI